MLADLVQGEFQQLETKEDEGQVSSQLICIFHTCLPQERFEHYLTKSFNKTASLMAHSCQANGKVFFGHTFSHRCHIAALLAGVNQQLVRDAFLYGRNIGMWHSALCATCYVVHMNTPLNTGVAFQLVDDLLDFTASADQLGMHNAAHQRTAQFSNLTFKWHSIYLRKMHCMLVWRNYLYLLLLEGCDHNCFYGRLVVALRNLTISSR